MDEGNNICASKRVRRSEGGNRMTRDQTHNGRGGGRGSGGQGDGGRGGRASGGHDSDGGANPPGRAIEHSVFRVRAIKVNIRVAVRGRAFMQIDLLVEEVVVVVVVVEAVVVQICPDERSNIPSLVAVEVSHASPQSVCANNAASENISVMSVTLDTSHLERSPLNDSAAGNSCA